MGAKRSGLGATLIVEQVAVRRDLRLGTARRPSKLPEGAPLGQRCNEGRVIPSSKRAHHDMYYVEPRRSTDGLALEDASGNGLTAWR